MSKRSTLGFIYTLQALDAAGADLTPLKQRYGIDLKNILPDADIERALELKIYCEILPSMSDPLTGLRIGQTMSLAGYGPLIMLLMTCHTAWDAFQAGVRYQGLTYLFGDLQLVAGESESLLCIKPSPMPEVCRRFLIDRDLSGTFQLIRDMQTSIGVDLDPVLIRIPYPKPPEAKAYLERFSCPVEFGASQTEIAIPTSYLATRFPAGNSTAHSLYQKQCDALLMQREKQASNLTEQVAEYLSLFTDVFPTSLEVATTFGMSERNFRRKLKEEDTSFRSLMDRIRFDKAKQLLEHTNLAIDAIAQQLGYAESAAFIHAFQRWSGITPSKFRSEHNST